MTTNKWKVTVEFETTFNWIEDGPSKAFNEALSRSLT